MIHKMIYKRTMFFYVNVSDVTVCESRMTKSVLKMFARRRNIRLATNAFTIVKIS